MQETVSYGKLWQTLTYMNQIQNDNIYLRLIEIGEKELNKMQADILSLVMGSIQTLLET